MRAARYFLLPVAVALAVLGDAPPMDRERVHMAQKRLMYAQQQVEMAKADYERVMAEERKKAGKPEGCYLSIELTWEGQPECQAKQEAQPSQKKGKQ